jgi:predicted TIM-barrel fold metal-dependent hydrolase
MGAQAVSDGPGGPAVTPEVVDVHAHFLPPGFARAIQAGDLAGELSPTLAAAMTGEAMAVVRSASAYLSAMDSAGVTTALLSVLPPGGQLPDRVLAGRIAAGINDELLQLAEEHRPRFGVLLALPLPHVAETLRELARVGQHPLAVGVEVFAASQPWTIADDELEPVYAAMSERQLPVLVHPALEQLPAAQRDWGLDAFLAAPLNSSLGALRLILSGMLDRVPALTPIVPHLGGVLPFLTQRIDDQARGVNQHPPSHYLRTRLLYDTCSFHPPALRATAETVGTDRLLLGSDFPFRGPLDRPVRDVTINLPGADHRAVLADNAVRAFPRLAGGYVGRKQE